MRRINYYMQGEGMRRSAPMPIDDNVADNNLDKHNALTFTVLVIIWLKRDS